MIKDAMLWVSNQYFSLDPEVRDEMAALPDKVLKVQLTGLNVHFYLQPTSDGLQLLRECERQPDAIVSGTPVAFIQMAIQQRLGNNATGEDIEIQGDAQFVHQVNTLMKKFRIDWEEILARSLGDRVAQSIGSWLRSSTNYVRQSADSMQQNITEFIQEEIRILPPREEVQDFMNDVDALRDRVERLIALLALQEDIA